MLTNICLLLVSVLPQGTPADGSGVLLLADGSKVSGRVLRTSQGYRVDSHDYRAEDVVRWIPKSELLATHDRLAAMPGAEAAFPTAQRALWAFEHGLDEQGFTALGQLQAQGERPPSLPDVERAAAKRLIAGTRIADPTDAARELLLRVDGRTSDPVRKTKNHVTPVALRQLLEREAAQPGTRNVANTCRKWAADAMNNARRRAARLALLGADDKSKEFVWRQAIQWPQGPTRTGVLADIQSSKQADDAALYLTRWLDQGNATLQVRSAETLGELGSPKALPALENARAKLRASAGGGGTTRAYVAFLEQQSYVSDFDVEIATAAAIADPKVSVLQSGVVLDVTVGGITWERYIVELGSALDRAIRALR